MSADQRSHPARPRLEHLHRRDQPDRRRRRDRLAVRIDRHAGDRGRIWLIVLGRVRGRVGVRHPQGRQVGYRTCFARRTAVAGRAIGIMTEPQPPQYPSPQYLRRRRPPAAPIRAAIRHPRPEPYSGYSPAARRAEERFGHRRAGGRDRRPLISRCRRRGRLGIVAVILGFLGLAASQARRSRPTAASRSRASCSEFSASSRQSSSSRCRSGCSTKSAAPTTWIACPRPARTRTPQRCADQFQERVEDQFSVTLTTPAPPTRETRGAAVAATNSSDNSTTSSRHHVGERQQSRTAGRPARGTCADTGTATRARSAGRADGSA